MVKKKRKIRCFINVNQSKLNRHNHKKDFLSVLHGWDLGMKKNQMNEMWSTEKREKEQQIKYLQIYNRHSVERSRFYLH